MKLLIDTANITPNDVVIVANNRQALTFKKQYQHVSATPPKVFTWSNILHYLWEQHSEFGKWRMLSSDESYYLFYKIIQASEVGLSASVAKEVFTNYSWCRKQRIPLNEIPADNEMQEYFLQWAKSYEARKKQYNAVDVFDIAQLCSEECATSNAQNFLSYGFKALTAEQQLLFKQLDVSALQVQPSKPIFENKTYQNTEEEVAACTRWAKKLREKDSNQSIAIIVPQLDKYYYYLNYECNTAFEQHLTQTKHKSFNISLGKPLTSFNSITTLFLTLKISKQIIESEITARDLSSLLLSKFIYSDNNQRFIQKILKLERQVITTTQLLEVVAGSVEVTRIIHQLSEMSRACKLGSIKSHQDWLQIFCEILNIWEFNQLRAMTSDEYQVWQKYLSSSLMFNGLTTFSKDISFSTAIFEFEKMLERVIFQPQSGSQQIQIMGLLEAEGLCFDHSWILGATNDVLPPVVKPLRFVNLTTCKKYKVPRSEYQHIMADSKTSIDFLSMSSSSPVISFSQLFNTTENFGSKFITWDEKCQEHLQQKNTRDALHPVANTKVKPLEETTISKGVKTLKDQIACPFKGFANRLGINEYSEEEIGLSSLRKGNILHKSLELIYTSIDSSVALSEAKTGELEQLVASSIDEAMAEYKRDGFYQVNRNHLTRKILEFLELEKSRDYWKIIALEKSQKVSIAQLEFFVRVDRIDANRADEKIIFDYKSGNATPNSWCGSISQPQLPIYATTFNGNAICFVNFKEKIAYRAMAENDEILEVKSKCCEDISWQEQTAQWSETLAHAATDFQNGIAKVTPIKGACKYCNLGSFCRVSNKQM